jgi:predicted metalloendopeptidase
MIKTIRQAFERNIPKADWMDDSTKEKALEKVRSDNCDLVNDHTT